MDIKEARKLIEFDEIPLDQLLSGIALDEDSLTKAYLIVYIDRLFKSGELNEKPAWKCNAIRELKDRTKKTYKKVHYIIRALDEKTISGLTSSRQLPIIFRTPRRRRGITGINTTR